MSVIKMFESEREAYLFAYLEFTKYVGKTGAITCNSIRWKGMSAILIDTFIDFEKLRIGSRRFFKRIDFIHLPPAKFEEMVERLFECIRCSQKGTKFFRLQVGELDTIRGLTTKQDLEQDAFLVPEEDYISATSGEEEEEEEAPVKRTKYSSSSEEEEGLVVVVSD